MAERREGRCTSLGAHRGARNISSQGQRQPESEASSIGPVVEDRQGQNEVMDQPTKPAKIASSISAAVCRPGNVAACRRASVGCGCLNRRIRGSLSAPTVRMRLIVGPYPPWWHLVGDLEAVSSAQRRQFVVLRQRLKGATDKRMDCGGFCMCRLSFTAYNTPGAPAPLRAG